MIHPAPILVLTIPNLTCTKFTHSLQSSPPPPPPPPPEFHSQLEVLMSLLVGVPPLVFTELRLQRWERAGRAREERRRLHREEMERSNREKVGDLMDEK